MKIIDNNGRLFGKISVIDVLVVAVVAVMAAALYVKSNQTHTGTSVVEETIAFQVLVEGVPGYVQNAIQVEDQLYDKVYESGGPLGRVTQIEVLPGKPSWRSLTTAPWRWPRWRTASTCCSRWRARAW